MISWCLVCERPVDVNTPNGAGVIPTETDCSIVCRPCVKNNLVLLRSTHPLDPYIDDNRDHNGWSWSESNRAVRNLLTKMVPSR